MRPILLLLLLAGCHDPVTAVTWNVGLAVGFVPGAEARLDGAASAIAALDADVVCVQEVWLPDQVAAIEAAAADTFPYTAFATPDPDDRPEPACAETDLAAITACAEANCDTTCVDGLADCLIASCPLPLAALPTDCQRCAFAQVGHDLDTIVQTCTTMDTRMSWDGSYGIGLLSRTPLDDVTLEAFPSALLRRGALHATTRTPAGRADVVCTHLAADLSPLPYTEDDGTWAGENEEQVGLLLDFAATGAEDRTIVMGDFNTGPAGDGFDAELAESWADVERSGFAVPFVDHVGTCTMCPDNPLRGEGSDEMLIDHVLIDGFSGEVTAARALEDTFSVTTCAGTFDAAWSDHYAVRVTAER